MYSAYITRIKNVHTHPNADRLLLGECFGNQIVVGLDTTEGELGIYFPTDGKLSLKYCEANNLLRYKDPTTGEDKGGYFDKNRKVRTQKFRGEKSDGFFMPLTSLAFTKANLDSLTEGTLITTLNGELICEKYVTPSTKKSGGPNKKKKGALQVKVKYPTFHEHIDTNQFAYNKNSFKPGDYLVLTLKMHGTSARTSYALEVTRRKFLFINFKEKRVWKHITGTRRVNLKEMSTESGGFYGSNEFRKPYHDHFVGKLHKGETVYYEIVGWMDEGTPIMSQCDNKKAKDKEFEKMYGPTTTFDYGCSKGMSDMYVYRITMSNEDGIEVDYSWAAVKHRCEELNVKHVPELCEPFIYNGDIDVLTDVVDQLAEGSDPIGKSHIREGVVVKRDGRFKFDAYKHKGFYFKLLESIIKDDDSVVDIEEVQEVDNAQQPENSN